MSANIWKFYNFWKLNESILNLNQMIPCNRLLAALLGESELIDISSSKSAKISKNIYYKN